MKPLLDSIHHEHHWKICDFSLNAPVLNMLRRNGLIISSLFQRRVKRGWGNDPLVDPQKIVLPPCNINKWWLLWRSEWRFLTSSRQCQFPGSMMQK